MDLSPDDAWRRIVPPTPRDVVKGGKTFQDLVGSYLCSTGLIVLNRRHLAGLAPLDSAAMSNFMILVADEIFSDHYHQESPGCARTPKRYLLKRGRLIESMPSRAVWVIKNHDPAKIEGRSRGGRHGAAQGVRKGPSPTLYPFMIAGFMHLGPGERRQAFQKAHPCSDSTFYKLQRRYLDRLNSPAPATHTPTELNDLLPDSAS